MTRVEFFAIPQLTCLITEGIVRAENFSNQKPRILKIIQQAVRKKISLIQIREKKLPARLLFELAVEAAAVTRHSGTGLLINDRADIALAAGADGAHLTSRSIPTGPIRRYFPKNFIIGVSAHSLKEARLARDEGADFATFSPIFETPSKALYGPPQGLEKLRAVCQAVAPFPIIALGGINETNFQTALDQGVRGFAAIRFLNESLSLK